MPKLVDDYIRDDKNMSGYDREKAERIIHDRYMDLPAESRKLLKKMLSEYIASGDPSKNNLYKEILSYDYLREPVGPEEFLNSRYYAGTFSKGLYKENYELLLHVLDPNDPVTELILTGAIGYGKTSISIVCLIYRLYRLSCLRNPAEFFKLMGSITRIGFGLYSVFQYKTDKAYIAMRSIVDGSPYFQENFPALKPVTLEFPNNIVILQGSRELSALGDDLLAVVMDEVNFMRDSANVQATEKLAQTQGQAQKLYTATLRRLRSRFVRPGGEVPGIVILISSKRAETSWLEKHMEEVRGKSGVVIVSHAIWDVNKQDYSGKKFYVMIGDEFTSNRILDKNEISPKGARIIDVPIEHFDEFEEDLDGAIRDVAGEATVAVSPLIRERENLKYIIDDKRHFPFTKKEISITTDNDLQLIEYLKLKELVTIRGGGYTPKVRPRARRIIHVDLAESQCSCGFCMGHVYTDVSTGIKLPVLYIDIILELKPPKSGVIDFQKVRQFIIHLHQYGYPLSVISYDGWESKDSMQRLRQYFGETKERKKKKKQVIDIDVLSVDKTDVPYLHAKAFIDNRSCQMYYYYPLISQITSVQHDITKKKVLKGDLLKDVADSFAGVAYHAATNEKVLYREMKK